MGFEKMPLQAKMPLCCLFLKAYLVFDLEPIGTIHSPYKEKFAIPRQPGLAPSVVSHIALSGACNTPEAVRGLENFSHTWVLFLFDQNLDAGFKPTVRPPRLGGNQRIGVFASRATFRPNGIGMSAVELVGVRHENGQVWIDIKGADMMHGTPIVDIKPYIAYSDALPDAVSGFAKETPQLLDVSFSTQADAFLNKTQKSEQYKQVISEVLAQDPRPAYKKGKLDEKTYAVHLFDFNVSFKVQQASSASGQDAPNLNQAYLEVTKIEQIKSN